MDDFEIIEEADDRNSLDPKEQLRKIKEKLEACNTERKEYLEGWQRAKADLLNFKKNDERRLNEWRERLENELILEFLAILDSFDLALGNLHRKHLSEEAERGFNLIRSQFAQTLRRMGVEEVPALGAKFNPSLHEAIDEIESDDEEGLVMEELQKGYKRGSAVLRPARVKVSKSKTT